MMRKGDMAEERRQSLHIGRLGRSENDRKGVLDCICIL